jgi:hypothetical protein
MDSGLALARPGMTAEGIRARRRETSCISDIRPEGCDHMLGSGNSSIGCNLARRRANEASISTINPNSTGG